MPPRVPTGIRGVIGPGAGVPGSNGCNMGPGYRIGFEKAIQPKKLTQLTKSQIGKSN